MKSLEWKTYPDSIMADTILGYFEITENQGKFSVDLWDDYGNHETFDDKQFNSQQEAIDFCQMIYDKRSPIRNKNVCKALSDKKFQERLKKYVPDSPSPEEILGAFMEIEKEDMDNE